MELKHILDHKDIKKIDLKKGMNSIIEGDALSVLKKIPDEIADLIFFDPPYFLQLPNKKIIRWNVNTEVSGVDEEWDQFDSFDHYDHFISDLLVEIQRIMKPTATLWTIATYHSVFRIGKLMQDLDYWLLNNLIWLKTNPMPNWLKVRFTNATETLIWAVKDKSSKGYTFHSDVAKEFGVGKIGANVWLIPLCSGKERLKDANGKKVHATQKPLELLRRIILSSSNPGDLIFDPLAGVGTSGYVAAHLERNYLMVEKRTDYVSAALERFKSHTKISSEPHIELGQKQYEYLFGITADNPSK